MMSRNRLKIRMILRPSCLKDDPNEENDPQNPSNQGNGNTTDPQQPDVSNPSQQPDTPDTPNTVTQPLALSHEDVTISGGESFVLSVQGSRDSVTYTVKDAAIARCPPPVR